MPNADIVSCTAEAGIFHEFRVLNQLSRVHNSQISLTHDQQCSLLFCLHITINLCSEHWLFICLLDVCELLWDYNGISIEMICNSDIR